MYLQVVCSLHFVPGLQSAVYGLHFARTCFVISPNSKVENNCKEIGYFILAGSQIWCSFKEHNLIIGKSKVHVVVAQRS